MRRYNFVLSTIIVITLLSCSLEGGGENEDISFELDTIISEIDKGVNKFFVYGKDSLVIAEWTEENGLMEGDYLKYNKSGVLVYEGAYLKGAKVGKHYEYYSNGNDWRLMHYVPKQEFDSINNRYVYPDSRLNYVIVLDSVGSLVENESVFYKIESVRDTFMLGENVEFTINYSHNHGGDSIWMQSGPYESPFFNVYKRNSGEISPVAYHYLDQNDEFHVKLKADILGKQIFASVIFDVDSKVDSVYLMYVKYNFYVLGDDSGLNKSTLQ